MCSVLADSLIFFSGSKTTISASEPGAIVPLRGKRPKIFAGDVEVSSTKRLREIRPARTPPSYTRLITAAMPCCVKSDRAVIGGHTLEIVELESPPQLLLFRLVAQRRAHHVLRAAEV